MTLFFSDRGERKTAWLRWFVFAMAASLAGQPAFAQKTSPTASDRFVLCESYCALVDGTGARVIDRVFEKLDDFSGPVAVYSHHNKSGAIDRSGHTIIKPLHDWIQVLGNRFLLAQDNPGGREATDNSATLSVLYDERGNELFRLKGETTFGSWGGHVFYRKGCRGNVECPTTFLDDRGQPAARFAVFREDAGTPLAIASADGKLYGFVDETLRFVIPPRYLTAQPFRRDVAQISTEAGAGLIDRRGRIVVPPGRYRNLFPWDETPLIDASPPDERNCGQYLRQDGKRLRLPNGVCPGGADYLETLGYAFVHDPRRLRGIIDSRGKILIRPAYPWLQGLNADYLVFGDDVSKPTRFGVVDRRGKIVLPLQSARIATYSAGCCSNPGALRDVLIATTAEGTGLLGLDGRWIVPAQYKEANVISPTLVALRDKDGPYRFFTTGGQAIDLTSAFEPGWSLVANRGPHEFFVFQQSVQVSTDNGGTATIWRKGVSNAAGHVVIPADYADIEDVGLGIWAVKKRIGSTDRIGLIDRTGKVIAEPQYSEIDKRFTNGAAVLSTAEGKTVLVDTTGKILSSFDKLFPDLANRGGTDPVDRALDICFDSDPAAEPEDRAAQAPAAKLVCADPALREQSRDTEKTWRNAQADDCLPDEFIALRPAYDRALADCADAACATNTMREFRKRIGETARRCSARPASGGASNKPVSAAIRARLTKRLKADNSDDLTDNDGRISLDFRNVSLAGRPAIMATANTGAHNGPLWLFAQGHQGRWDELFEGYVGYLRPLEIVAASRNGMPVLRTQQHVSCCEHAVEYYGYDGRGYKLLHSCTQLYDADETPLLFCDDSSRKDQ